MSMRKEIPKMSNAGIDRALDVLIDVFREHRELLDALFEANGVLRSTMSIAERRGSETNWESYEKHLSAVLVKQHALLSRLGAYDAAYRAREGDAPSHFPKGPDHD